jgi:hypothetical protein
MEYTFRHELSKRPETMSVKNISMTQQQVGLWAIILICERLFYIYCEYSGREKNELRELLDELWTINLEKETYFDEQVSGIQTFIGSLYPKAGSQEEYVGAGFIVALVDVYDYIISRKGVYVESIKSQGIDSIRHHLEWIHLTNEDLSREVCPLERKVVENSREIQREISAQASFEKEIQYKSIIEVKEKYIYDPIS